jgi:hypothetical protein
VADVRDAEILSWFTALQLLFDPKSANQYWQADPGDSAFSFQKAVKFGKCILWIVFCGAGFGQFGFSVVNSVGGQN